MGTFNTLFNPMLPVHFDNRGASVDQFGRQLNLPKNILYNYCIQDNLSRILSNKCGYII